MSLETRANNTTIKQIIESKMPMTDEEKIKLGAQMLDFESFEAMMKDEQNEQRLKTFEALSDRNL